MGRNKRRRTPKIETVADFIGAIIYNAFDDYCIDKNVLSRLLDPLIKLDMLVGMESLKQEVLHMVMYYMQGLHEVILSDGTIDRSKSGRMNAVILGPSGIGKTTVAYILAEIYAAMGVVSKSRVTVVRRTDFIAKYLGHTEDKTRRLLKQCRGSVMFIDEAYNMSNGKNDMDSYSRIALDLLNQFITDTDDFACIIAGYEKELYERFFSSNPGLERRFTWRFVIENYTPKELLEIFKLKVNEIHWRLDDEAITEEFFVMHKDDFPRFGGDIETLLLMCKTEHAMRVFGKNPMERYTLINDDISAGFKKFMIHKKPSSNFPEHMYL